MHNKTHNTNVAGTRYSSDSSPQHFKTKKLKTITYKFTLRLKTMKNESPGKLKRAWQEFTTLRICFKICPKINDTTRFWKNLRDTRHVFFCRHKLNIDPEFSPWNWLRKTRLIENTVTLIFKVKHTLNKLWFSKP